MLLVSTHVYNYSFKTLVMKSPTKSIKHTRIFEIAHIMLSCGLITRCIVWDDFHLFFILIDFVSLDLFNNCPPPLLQKGWQFLKRISASHLLTNQRRLITFNACTYYVKLNRIKYAMVRQLAEPEYKAKKNSDWRVGGRALRASRLYRDNRPTAHPIPDYIPQHMRDMAVNSGPQLRLN